MQTSIVILGIFAIIYIIAMAIIDHLRTRDQIKRIEKIEPTSDLREIGITRGKLRLWEGEDDPPPSGE